MQKNSFYSFLFTVFILSALTTKANITSQSPLADSCCTPDSLKIVSANYPLFCVSWHVSSDSNCRTPYGFEIQWRYYPTSNPRFSAIKVYSGGSTIEFCSKVDTCRAFEWRVRTICDTSHGGIYSNWVYGPKINVRCPSAKSSSETDLPGNKKPGQEQEKTGIRPNAVKQKEQ